MSIPAHAQPYANLPALNNKLFEAKAAKGITFGEIGKAIGKDEVWVAAAFYGQAKFTLEQLAKVAEVLGLNAGAGSLNAELGDHWFPNRGGLGPVPPTDPTIYRLYEAILVYGQPIKAVLHEKFGDGIMSMIDCKVTIDKKSDPKGDRAVLTFDGKWLPYATW